MVTVGVVGLVTVGVVGLVTVGVVGLVTVGVVVTLSVVADTGRLGTDVPPVFDAMTS